MAKLLYLWFVFLKCLYCTNEKEFEGFRRFLMRVGWVNLLLWILAIWGICEQNFLILLALNWLWIFVAIHSKELAGNLCSLFLLFRIFSLLNLNSNLMLRVLFSFVCNFVTMISNCNVLIWKALICFISDFNSLTSFSNSLM